MNPIDDQDLFYDAFVVAVLPLIIERQENLIVEGTVDATLLAQLNNKVIPQLCGIHNIQNNLTITTSKTVFKSGLNCNTVATGASCGVDSLATIKEFKDVNKKLDYLSFFDAGSHGLYGADNTLINYNHRLSNALEVSQKLGLELITVKTNAHQFLKGRFKSAHSFLNLSCAFATLGIINEYHYASAYKINQITEESGDTSNYDHLILPQLHASYFLTKSTLGDKNRIERLAFILNYKLSQKHLDVCTNSVRANQMGCQNCSSCEKCMRTAATLELMNSLKKHDKVFNIEQFQFNLDVYISTLLGGKNSIHDSELLELLNVHNRVHFKHFYLAFKVRLRNHIKSFYSYFKSK
jgi:hypothetical protein